MQPTVVTCVPDVITESDDSQDPACESSSKHERCELLLIVPARQDDGEGRRRVRDQSAAEADEERRTEQEDLSSHGPHNERARGVRHEDVASLVPACSGARVLHSKAGKTPLVPRSGQSIVRNWSRGAH